MSPKERLAKAAQAEKLFDEVQMDLHGDVQRDGDERTHRLADDAVRAAGEFKRHLQRELANHEGGTGNG